MAKVKVKKRLDWPKIFRVIGYLAVCVLALGAGSFYGWIKDSDLTKQIVTDLLTNRDPKDAWDGRGSVTLLILGCDEDRYYHSDQILKQQARSDLMLVARLDFNEKTITGVSIPRDTEVRLRGYPKHKINAFHAIGGPELAKQAVEKIVPVQIDRVVVLDFDEFQKMVDAVGGVVVDVDKEMDYDDNAGNLHIHLKPGVQRLDGYTSMCYVRYRHSDDDFHRQARQKDFLVSFKNSVMQHKASLPNIVSEAGKVLGGALANDEISSLAMFARTVDQKNIKLGMVPTVPGRGSFLKVDQDKLEATLIQYKLVETGSRRQA